MTKTPIKITNTMLQQGLCTLSYVRLPHNPSLYDVHRIIDKSQGGPLTLENTQSVEPLAHMEHHGNRRQRPGWMDELKSLMDDRRQTQKLETKINNQLLQYTRKTDEFNQETKEFLDEQLEPITKRLSKIDRKITKHINESDDPLIQAAMGVHKVGPITVAGLTVYVDLEKAQSASALWKYVGLHTASHERYQKGQASGGNKTLRTILWNTANCMMKDMQCPYRAVYDHTKQRLEQSEKITKTRINDGGDSKLVERAWKDTSPGHRHGAALRAMTKHFLADYWFVGRELRGLSTRPLYAQEYLGHTGIVQPSERGWEW